MVVVLARSGKAGVALEACAVNESEVVFGVRVERRTTRSLQHDDGVHPSSLIDGPEGAYVCTGVTIGGPLVGRSCQTHIVSSETVPKALFHSLDLMLPYSILGSAFCGSPNNVTLFMFSSNSPTLFVGPS